MASRPRYAGLARPLSLRLFPRGSLCPGQLALGPQSLAGLQPLPLAPALSVHLCHVPREATAGPPPGTPPPQPSSVATGGKGMRGRLALCFQSPATPRTSSCQTCSGEEARPDSGCHVGLGTEDRLALLECQPQVIPSCLLRPGKPGTEAAGRVGSQGSGSARGQRTLSLAGGRGEHGAPGGEGSDSLSRGNQSEAQQGARNPKGPAHMNVLIHGSVGPPLRVPKVQGPPLGVPSRRAGGWLHAWTSMAHGCSVPGALPGVAGAGTGRGRGPCLTRRGLQTALAHLQMSGEPSGGLWWQVTGNPLPSA